MGKKGKGGHKKSKAPLVRTGAKILVLAAGAKTLVLNDDSVVDLVRYHLSNPKSFRLSDPNLYKEYAKRTIPGALLILAGPKAVDVIYKAIPAPEIKRMKVPGSSRKVV